MNDSILENVDSVLVAMGDLRDLRDELARLDEERQRVERQISARLTQIVNSVTVVPVNTNAPLLPATREVIASRWSTKDRVRHALELHPGEAFGALDVAKWLDVSGETAVNSIRAALSRLAKDKTIVKLSYGRYVQAAAGGGNKT